MTARVTAVSSVVHLTPAEMAELGASIRRLLAGYRGRDEASAARPTGTVAVAAVTRLFSPARPLRPPARQAKPDGPACDAGREWPQTAPRSVLSQCSGRMWMTTCSPCSRHAKST